MQPIPIKVRVSPTDAIVRACDKYWNKTPLDTITEELEPVCGLHDMASSQVAAFTEYGIILQEDLETLMKEDYPGLTGRKRVGCASKELWWPMGHKRVMYVFPDISCDDIVAVHMDDFKVIVKELTDAITADGTVRKAKRSYKPIYETTDLPERPAKRAKRSK